MRPQYRGSLLRSADTEPFQNALMRWGRLNSRGFAWRRRLPFWQGLIAESLLVRTRAEQAERIFGEILRRFPNARAMADSDLEALEELLNPLGLHWRKRLVARLMQEIGRRGGRLPRDPDQLMRLPGVGPYVASAALAFHGGERNAVIDSNVVRVLSRVAGQPFDGETRRKPWLAAFADKLTPASEYQLYGYSLLDLGALVCLPREPACHICPIMEWCRLGVERG